MNEVPATAGGLRHLADALTGALPSLDATDQRVAIAPYRLLARGRPASAEEIAAVARVTAADVGERMGAWPSVFRDDQGQVVGSWGLTIAEMPPHELLVGDARLWAWFTSFCHFVHFLASQQAGEQWVGGFKWWAQRPVRLRHAGIRRTLMRGHMTNEQKQLAFRLRAEGLSLAEIGRQVGCTGPMVGLMVRAGMFRTGLPDEWKPRPGRLTIRDREQILVGLHHGAPLAAIARALSRPTSTVSREVAANGGRDGYAAWRSHQRARARARRPRPFKLQRGALLRAVSRDLIDLWSPQQVSQRLRLDYPDDPQMRVSHETIYQSLYVQGRGELRRELVRCLRSGRAQRRARGTVDGRGRIPGMVMLSERPPEAQDRAIPGHWEGDIILGEGGRSAVGTLVERTTRYTLLLHLENRSAVAVEAAMRRSIQMLPTELRRSVTWDQGAEMATHASFTISTGIPIYFCDPHSPWQRGSNENTNRLLRQYPPKGSDLAKVSRSELRRIQRSLNGRPRKTLDYRTPYEKMSELVALTA